MARSKPNVKSPKPKASSSGPAPSDAADKEAKDAADRMKEISRMLLEHAGDDFPLAHSTQTLQDKLDPAVSSAYLNDDPDPAVCAAIDRIFDETPYLTPEQRQRLRDKPLPLGRAAETLQYMPEEMVKRFADEVTGGGPRVQISIDKALLEDPEIKTRGDRMTLLHVDYDPQSPTYKHNALRDGPRKTMALMDHVESEAPFAIGLGCIRDTRRTLWLLWGNIDEDEKTLGARAEDQMARAEEQRVICLDLYDKHGAKARSHTKFGDAYNAYLYLSAKASASQHLTTLRSWQTLLESSITNGDIDFIGVVRASMAKSEAGQIGERVESGTLWISRGDKLLFGRQSTKRENFDAAAHYLRGLADLAPYLAVEWYMLPDEDTQGLSNVEISLHLKLAQVGLEIGALSHAALSLQAVHRNPFITNSQLAEACRLYRRMHELECLHGEAGAGRTPSVNRWPMNAKIFEALAQQRGSHATPWHVQYEKFSLDEKMRRLQGLGVIMPALYGRGGDKA